MSRKIGTGQTTKQRLVHSLLLSSPACLLVGGLQELNRLLLSVGGV
jgi:hypothetical protein